MMTPQLDQAISAVKAIDYPPQGQWTYADYKRLPDDGWRYEVLEGELRMSPAPKTRHQRAIMNLTLAFGNFVRAGHLGEV